MIKEDYVSFETAKLLKEKGFDWECKTRKFYSEPEYDAESPNGVYAPTHQTAIKWLREVHNIETSISYGFPFIDGKRVFKYYWCPVKVTEKGLEYPMDDPDTVEFIEGMADSYEQAIEETIKYCLENLI